MTGPNTMSLARNERTELAELLADLTPDQWNAPTLCEQWRVRELVAHVYSYEDLGWVRLAVRMLTAGGSVDRANAAGVADHADKSPDELLARARKHIQPAGLTSMMGGRIALTDGMIHQQDIRRPLGLPREIPGERLVAALDTARTAPTLSATKLIKGLTLQATDLDWSTGTGPLVEGTGEALLMAMAGRRGMAAEFTGPGATTLAARLTV